MADNTVFNDIMDALREVEEYQKGNIELKSRTVEIPDYDIAGKYNQLPEDVKKTVRNIIDSALKQARV